MRRLTPTHAYKVLTALLYGRHSFIQRHPGGGVTAHANQLRQCLGISTTSKLRTSLEKLADLGLISGFQWHKHWFYCRTVPPVDMARVAEVVGGDPSPIEGVHVTTTDLVHGAPRG